MDFSQYLPPRSFRVGQTQGLVRDHVPQSLVNRLCTLIHNPEVNALLKTEAIWELVRDSVGAAHDYLPHRDAPFRMQSLVQEGATDIKTFLDVAEAFFRAVVATSRYSRTTDYVLGCANEMFLLDHMGFRVDAAGLIIDAGSDIENAAIDDARTLLAGDPRFTDADAKFTGALGSLARRDLHQYPEAAASAVSALEDICRKLLGDEKVTLDKALDRICKKTDVHQTLIDSLKGVYYYRGDQAGAAHGAGEGSEHEARFVIHLVAAGITMVIAAMDGTHDPASTPV